MRISIIIATRNRAQSLRSTLASIQSQQVSERDCEIIVVDNGSSDHTPSILVGKPSCMQLTALHEPIAGKSRALNRAMDVATGDLLIFTDDDITPSADWLPSIYRASLHYEAAKVFCGPITPSFPADTPAWLQNHPHSSAMFGRFEPGLPEGPLPSPLSPFGANFGVRLWAARSERYRLDLGPSAENGPLFNEDTEFVRRFRSTPASIIYVPGARAFHTILPAQLEMPAIAERAFNLGRGQVAEWREPHFPGTRRVFRQSANDESISHKYERGGLINYYCGQMHQFRRIGDSEHERECQQKLSELHVFSNTNLLGPTARKECLCILATLAGS